MKTKNNFKKAGIISGTLITGLIAGITADAANTNELYRFDDLGSGAEVRTELIDMNIVKSALNASNTFEAKFAEEKCGEGKCGEKDTKKDQKVDDSKKKADKKSTDKKGKTTEAKCGEKDSKKDDKKDDKKQKEDKTKEAKCGEGKCGL